MCENEPAAMEHSINTTTNAIQHLVRWARLLRYDTLRMIANANSGHPGGCLSIADILACLYFSVMRVRPKDPDWPERDRFILSKGHAVPILYAALSRRGFFPVTELKKLRRIGSFLHGHPDISTPGVDMTTGCLGEGLSAAIGMALAGRLNKSDFRVFVVLGDGEMNEGQLWEAAASATHFHLSRITAILDYNNLQFDGHLEAISNPGDVPGRWTSLGWKVIEIDGHSIPAILDALQEADKSPNAPTLIMAHTTKGKGVDYMENDVMWHSLMDADKLQQTVGELKKELERDPDGFYAQRLW